MPREPHPEPEPEALRLSLKRFWDLIAFANSAPESERFDRLRAELLRLRPEDVLAFRRRYGDLSGQAYNNALWSAAALILDGCSEDSFMDFRDWLVAQGKEVYEAALASPDSLADVLKDDSCEVGLDGAALYAWMELTGRENVEYYERIEEDSVLGEDDLGEDFEHDAAELRRRFPKLWARAEARE